MRLWTSFLPSLNSIDETTDTAVVIDILRATTVMTVACANGATEIATICDVQTARELANATTPRPLLCGERACVPIRGFDCGNSPAEYSASKVNGRHLVVTTTNGTKAIQAASLAKEVILGSFLNQRAVADYLDPRASIALVCAGTDGCVSMEDVLFAGALVSDFQSRSDHHELPSLELNDESRIACQLWRARFGPQTGEKEGTTPDPTALAACLSESHGGQNLIRAGYEADLLRCAQVDSISVVSRRIATRAEASIFGC
ncbi:2-phosphosulfolactate phosphatase [Novipirellula sp. SH528]|uniref:2-phosphosulfolactate phosphatase n=1 Tax=Novipirellula sp. SH528 TaxID=3454466 RepID=UPI003FA141DF